MEHLLPLPLQAVGKHSQLLAHGGGAGRLAVRLGYHGHMRVLLGCGCHRFDHLHSGDPVCGHGVAVSGQMFGQCNRSVIEACARQSRLLISGVCCCPWAVSTS